MKTYRYDTGTSHMTADVSLASDDERKLFLKDSADCGPHLFRIELNGYVKDMGSEYSATDSVMYIYLKQMLIGAEKLGQLRLVKEFYGGQNSQAKTLSGQVFFIDVCSDVSSEEASKAVDLCLRRAGYALQEKGEQQQQESDQEPVSFAARMLNNGAFSVGLKELLADRLPFANQKFLKALQTDIEGLHKQHSGKGKGK